MSLWLSTAIIVVLSLPALLFIRPIGSSQSSELLRAAALGILVVLASLYPYWLFGPASAIGWYDEYDGIIQYYLTSAKSSTLAQFAHGYAGGSMIGDVFPDIGNGIYDLYLVMIKLIGPEFASLVYRLQSNALLYLGIFFSARYLLKAAFVASVLAGLVALFGTVYPSGWVLGGYGWDLAMMVWLPPLFLSRGHWAWRLVWAVVFAVAAAGTTTIVFFVPFGVLYGCLAVYLIEGRLWPTLRRNFLTIVAMALVSGAMTANTVLTLLTSLKDSSRYQSVNGPDALAAALSGGPPVKIDLLSTIGEGLNEAFLRGLGTLIGRGLLGFPPTIILTSLAALAAIWLTVSQRSPRYLICLLGPLVMVGALTYLGGSFELPFISAFRWDSMYVCVIVLFGLVFAAFQVRAAGRAGRLASLTGGALIFVAVVIGAASPAQRALSELDTYGGWATLKQYPQLATLAAKDPLARAASLPGYQPKPLLAPYYGLDVVDGMRGNFSWRRTAFWFEVLAAKPRAVWHTHRQVLGSDLGEVNTDAFRMIAGKYLMSPIALDDPALTEVAFMPGIRLADLGSPYMVLAKVMPTLSLAPDFFVYRLDDAWDRVFAPLELELTSADDFELAYFRQLRQLDRHTVLVPANAPGWLRGADRGNLSIKAVAKLPTGIEIETGGQGGLLIYNQEFATSWQALCSAESLDIAPVNGMMMAVSVPPGCNEVHFTYAHP